MLVEKEYEDSLQRTTYAGFGIFFKEKNNDEYEFQNTKTFFEKVNMRNFKGIKVEFYEFNDKQVEICIYTKSSSYFTIKGPDAWERQMREDLLELFERYRTRNDFFHKRKSWVIWTILGFFLALLYVNYIPTSTWAQINTLTMTSNFAYFSRLFSQFLCPMVENEHMVRIKLRNWLWVGLGTIPFALLINYIQSFIHK